MGDPELLESVVEIVTQQSADSTMKNATNHFAKWRRFATEHHMDVLPPHAEGPALDAFNENFNLFVVTQYNLHKNKTYKNGVIRPNKPQAFKAVFSGINHIIDRFLDAPCIGTKILEQAKRTYSRKYAGNPPKKAKPLEWHHLVNLVNLAKYNNEPFVMLTVAVTICGWFSAGRWSCLDACDVQKTVAYVEQRIVNPSPNGEFSYFFWKSRKNRPGLSYTIIPKIADKDYDPRTAFLNILTMFNRSESAKLIPAVKKRQNIFIVDSDPKKHCSYHQFLQMFRQVMMMAGNSITLYQCVSTTSLDMWTLHCYRRGFVKTARSAKGKSPLHWEIVIIHGGWKPSNVDTAFEYNDVDPADHAASLSELYASVMTSSTSSLALAPPVPQKRRRLQGRQCRVKSGGIWLPALLISDHTLPMSHYRVQVGRKVSSIPAASIRLVGLS